MRDVRIQGGLGSVSPAVVEGGLVVQTVQFAAVAGAGRLAPPELAVVLLLAGMS